MKDSSEIALALERGEAKEVARLVQTALDSGVEAKQVLDDGLIAGMAVGGGQFRRHEIFLPNVLMAAKAMYAGLDLLTPLLQAGDDPHRGTAVIGTVRGDLHDIGKNLVGIMLRGAGFQVIDLGNDVSSETFVAKAQEHGAKVIGMSALLTTTMPGMAEVVELLKAKGLSGKIRTVIGGAPVSKEFAEEIGADAYAFDGVSAVDRVSDLMEMDG
ncbi:corrinoid protein [bacterium]|nr:corrinoid protein [bacterium]